MLYTGPGVVMILDDDAQAGVVCARLIDIQGWLPLLCGYYHCPRQDSVLIRDISIVPVMDHPFIRCHDQYLAPGTRGLLRKIVIQSGNWDTVFSSHHPRHWTPLLCHAARDNPTLISRHDVTNKTLHTQHLHHKMLLLSLNLSMKEDINISPPPANPQTHLIT